MAKPKIISTLNWRLAGKFKGFHDRVPGLPEGAFNVRAEIAALYALLYDRVERKDNRADLKNLTPPKNFWVVSIAYLAAADDQLGGTFAWIEDFFGTPDDQDIIASDVASNGFWIRISGGLGGGGGGTGSFSGDATSIRSVLVDPVHPTSSGQTLRYDSALGKYVVAQLTQDDILTGFWIGSFTRPAGSLVEVGTSVPTPAFTASYSALPLAAASLTDTEGTPAKNVLATPTSFTSNGTFAKFSNAQSVTFTITATKDAIVRSANFALSWGVRIYYGASSSVSGPFNAGFITGLSASVVTTSRGRSITYNLIAGQRFVIALPQVLGSPTFTVGGFLVSPDVLATGVSVTNPQGVAVLCNLYGVSNFASGPSSATVVIT